MINNSEIINISKNSESTILEFLIDDQKDVFLKTLLNILILRREHLLIIILLIKMRVKIFLRIIQKINFQSNANFKKIYIFFRY